jgi:hypothetical protein
MAEEKKSNVSKMVLKVLIGIVLMALGAVSIYYWWPELLVIIKGMIGIILILVGLIFFAITKD